MLNYRNISDRILKPVLAYLIDIKCVFQEFRNESCWSWRGEGIEDTFKEGTGLDKRVKVRAQLT